MRVRAVARNEMGENATAKAITYVLVRIMFMEIH